MGLFYQAVTSGSSLHGDRFASRSPRIIAEIKRKSPSHGNFPQHQISSLVPIYEMGGAAAISVVTDSHRFGGSLDLLREVREHTRLPLLRKDFLSSRQDIDETAAAGASGVLLIAHDLHGAVLADLASYALSCGLDPLLEIHTMEDIEKIRASFDNFSGILFGINNRNLVDFSTDVRHGLTLLDDPLFPRNIPVVLESALTQPSDLLPYVGKISAALIGTSLLTSAHPYSQLISFTRLAL